MSSKGLKAKASHNFSSKVIMKAIDTEMTSVILDTSITFQTMVKKLLNMFGPGDPSKPGESPHKQSGNLGRSWGVQVSKAQVKKVGSNRKLRIGSNLDYAYFLEEGTENMLARPYISVVLKDKKFKSWVNKRVKMAKGRISKSVINLSKANN